MTHSTYDRPITAPRLYADLAAWFPLLTPREDYSEEARIYQDIIERHCVGRSVQTLVELGCGGGHNASYLKARFRLTLTELSSEMLALSICINPNCEHLQGDMRTLRLERHFDAVLIHDAISYMTSEADLAATLTTAFVHCAPGGVALFCPDSIRETFQEGTEHGGSDSGERGIRYLEWTTDPDPNDHQYQTDFAFLLREGENIWVERDRHTLGLFSRADWERLIRQAGFECLAVPFEHKDVPDGSVLFVGRKAE